MHKYTRSEARTATLNARREGDESPRYQYYEDISSDDEILDLLNEGPAVNEIQQMDILNDFDISKLDPVSSVDGSHNDVTPDNSSVVSAESSVSVSVDGSHNDVIPDNTSVVSTGSSVDVSVAAVVMT